MNSVKIEITL